MTRLFFSLILIVLVVWLLSAAGCIANGPATYQVESDNDFKYRPVLTPIPVDHTLYAISGIVGGDPNSAVRQTQAAQGEMTTIDGTGSGSYTGPSYSGKNVVRLYVTLAEPPTDLAPPGATVLVKATDLKAIGLEAGDFVTLLCRSSAEAVSPAFQNQEFDPETMLTYELDDCRLRSGIVRAETGR